MSNVEIVEKLTDIVARQAEIIRKLHSVVEQLDATTDLAPEIAEVQRQADIILGKPGD